MEKYFSQVVAKYIDLKENNEFEEYYYDGLYYSQEFEGITCYYGKKSSIPFFEIWSSTCSENEGLEVLLGSKVGASYDKINFSLFQDVLHDPAYNSYKLNYQDKFELEVYVNDQNEIINLSIMNLELLKENSQKISSSQKKFQNLNSINNSCLDDEFLEIAWVLNQKQSEKNGEEVTPGKFEVVVFEKKFLKIFMTVNDFKKNSNTQKFLYKITKYDEIKGIINYTIFDGFSLIKGVYRIENGDLIDCTYNTDGKVRSKLICS